jgi:hypothetical protein
MSSTRVGGTGAVSPGTAGDWASPPGEGSVEAGDLEAGDFGVGRFATDSDAAGGLDTGRFGTGTFDTGRFGAGRFGMAEAGARLAPWGRPAPGSVTACASAAPRSCAGALTVVGWGTGAGSPARAARPGATEASSTAKGLSGA